MYDTYMCNLFCLIEHSESDSQPFLIEIDLDKTDSTLKKCIKNEKQNELKIC